MHIYAYPSSRKPGRPTGGSLIHFKTARPLFPTSKLPKTAVNYNALYCNIILYYIMI